MDISGSYTLYAPRERVWAALLDPDMLKQTVPGCERLDKESEGTFLLRLNIGVASVKGIYDGT
ncbi:MAG: CoxG family protein, partial [Ktedonobacterales bacterium]